MAIKASGANISNCGAGIAAFNGGKVYADGANLSGCDIGVISDSSSEVNVNNANLENCTIGLLSVNEFDKFIKILNENKIDLQQFKHMLHELNNSSSSEDKENIVKKFHFFEFLGKIESLDFVIQKSLELYEYLKNFKNQIL